MASTSCLPRHGSACVAAAGHCAWFRFLATYLAGLTLGSAELPEHHLPPRVPSGLATVAEIALFFARPACLSKPARSRADPRIALAAVAAFIARLVPGCNVTGHATPSEHLSWRGRLRGPAVGWPRFRSSYGPRTRVLRHRFFSTISTCCKQHRKNPPPDAEASGKRRLWVKRTR